MIDASPAPGQEAVDPEDSSESARDPEPGEGIRAAAGQDAREPETPGDVLNHEMTGYPILGEKHLDILHSISRFARVKRYHGMLPAKHTFLYSPQVLDDLLRRGLVEEGEIIAPCGSSFTGYRLTDSGKSVLEDEASHAAKKTGDAGEGASTLKKFVEEELEPRHLDTLHDIYRFGQVKKFYGIMPKHMVEHYDRKHMDLLYDLGLILYIKIKGPRIRYTKGYVVSEFGRSVLQEMGHLSRP
jgi:hypothetical protein